jgi:hypothetical protein
VSTVAILQNVFLPEFGRQVYLFCFTFWTWSASRRIKTLPLKICPAFYLLKLNRNHSYICLSYMSDFTMPHDDQIKKYKDFEIRTKLHITEMHQRSRARIQRLRDITTSISNKLDGRSARLQSPSQLCFQCTSSYKHC